MPACAPPISVPIGDKPRVELVAFEALGGAGSARRISPVPAYRAFKRACRHARSPACAVAAAALLAVGAPVACAFGILIQQAPLGGVTVTPAAGGPQTRFVFAFATPVATGRLHDTVRYEEVRGNTTGSGKSVGCSSSFELAVPYAAAGARVSAESRPGMDWCAGTYDADVVELARQGCPLYRCTQGPVTSVVGTFDRFSFIVT
jgi:hypothetical protein